MTFWQKVDFLINKLEEIYPNLDIPLDHKDEYTLLKELEKLDSVISKKVDDDEYKIRLPLAGWTFEKWVEGKKYESSKEVVDFFTSIEEIMKKLGIQTSVDLIAGIVVGNITSSILLNV